MLVRCPHDELIEKIDDAENLGYLTSQKAAQIRGLIMQGQSERANVQAFFSQLSYQATGVLSSHGSRSHAVNIRTAVEHAGLLMIDIGSSTNDLLVNLLVNEIKDMFLKGLPIYRNITIKDKSYFLTHSGYHADFEIIDPKTGLVNIQKSVDSAVAWDQEQYLFSNDIHYIPQKIKFDKRIIVGHYATLFLAEYRQANIYYGDKYIDIDTGNERRNRGGRLACLRLNDGREYYV